MAVSLLTLFIREYIRSITRMLGTCLASMHAGGVLHAVRPPKSVHSMMILWNAR